MKTKINEMGTTKLLKRLGACKAGRDRNNAETPGQAWRNCKNREDQAWVLSMLWSHLDQDVKDLLRGRLLRRINNYHKVPANVQDLVESGRELSYGTAKSLVPDTMGGFTEAATRALLECWNPTGYLREIGCDMKTGITWRAIKKALRRKYQ